MTADEIERALGLIVQAQQRISNNMDTLLQITQQNVQAITRNTDAIARNTETIAAVAAQIDRLAVVIADYIRGLRNGHNGGQ
jgi:hypothetical protein